jgi:hypothetical protein
MEEDNRKIYKHEMPKETVTMLNLFGISTSIMLK